MAAEQETILECWVIIIILSIAAYMFIRSHRKLWAGSVLPLMIVPFVTIIYNPINRRIMRFSAANAHYVRIIVYIVAFAAVCVWVVMWGQKLPSGKSKIAYMILGIGFTLALILIFIRNLLVRPYFG
jgi:hypothetical protein